MKPGQSAFEADNSAFIPDNSRFSPSAGSGPCVYALATDVAVLKKDLERMEQLHNIRLQSLDTQFGLSLSAMDKATSAAFAASEKAIVKAEEAQREYNLRSNEFREALNDQNKLMAQSMVPRPEWAFAHEELGKKLDEVKRIQTLKADAISVMALQKLVYIGVGMAILISFLIPVMVSFLRSK